MTDKSKVLKLANKLGVTDIDVTNTSKKYWSDLLAELQQEQRHNMLVDDMKVNMPRAINERKFNEVIDEIKNPGEDKYEFEIKIAGDPPKVDKHDIENALGNIRVDNYSIAFAVTSTVLQRDEEHNIIGEAEMTTPSQIITHNQFNRRYERNPSGALAGFLTRYLAKAQKSSEDLKAIRLVLVKKIRAPRQLTPLKDGASLNCLVNIVSNRLSKRKNYKKELQPLLQKLNDKYFETGVTEAAIDEICSKCKINIIVMTPLQETWYENYSSASRLTIVVCGHNGHATEIEKEINITDLLNKERKAKDVRYLSLTELEKQFFNDPKPIKFPFVINDKVVAFFGQDGILYKNQDIFVDEEDFEKNKNNPKLYTTWTLTSRYYKEKRSLYDIQDRYKDIKLYNFVRAADHHTKSWCSNKEYFKNSYAMDMTRAYMFYEKSRFYDHYQFPRIPTQFYSVTDQTIQDQLLNLTGFAQVDNVDIPKRLQFLYHTEEVQSNAVYTTMYLSFVKSLGVTFDIKAVAFCHNKQKIDFSIRLTEWQSSALHVNAQKQFENALMGRLIPNQVKGFERIVHCQDPNEFLMLRYQLKNVITNVDTERQIIKYIEPQDPDMLRGAYHIHAYILDYQRIELIEQAMKVPFSDILKVKVDCLILKKLPTEIPQHWHVERDIKEVDTHLLQETNFEHRTAVTDDLSPLPLTSLSSQFIELTGNAGTGKTYTACNWKLYDACVAVPNNNLKIKFRKEYPDIPCFTYHKLFQINTKAPVDPPRYSTYIMDECSMICKGVMNAILNHKHAKDATMILIHDPKQLAPVVPAHDRWQDSSPYFTEGREYNKRRWNQIHLTEQKRQTDPVFIEKLEKIRNLNAFPEKLSILQDRIIDAETAKQLYRFDTEDIVLASKNVLVDQWNQILKAIAPANRLKVKFTRSTKRYANNERVINVSEVADNQELAFASTIHLVQGLTFTARIFIVKQDCNFDPALFYTAVSRVKTIDDIFIIE